MPTIIDCITDLKGQVYDYTKVFSRESTPNYDLTFSMSEDNRELVKATLDNGDKVAVVFNTGNKRTGKFPSQFMGYPVISGDNDDNRFLDRKRSKIEGGLVVGLRAKGDALFDRSGFVIHAGDDDILSSEQDMLYSPFTKKDYIRRHPMKQQIKRSLSFSKDNILQSVANFIDSNKSLLSKDNANPKTEKSYKNGYFTSILHLAPAKESRIVNLCPFASIGCASACLHTAGSIQYLTNKVIGRIIKTWVWKMERDWFLSKLVKELELAANRAKKQSLKFAFRPNGTSDILWERVDFNF